jgi:hypothetical protein
LQFFQFKIKTTTEVQIIFHQLPKIAFSCY